MGRQSCCTRRHATTSRGVDVGLGDVLAVPVQQVVEFGVDVFGRAVLVDDAVGRVRLLGMVLKAPAWSASSNHWPNWFTAR